jgi:predicted O-methyltransferase YrrM
MTEQIELFSRIKKETHGYLTPETYQAIHEAAKAAPPGIVIDIGPAQGGSTISLATGRRDAGHDIEVYSLDMFRGSKALKYKHDVQKNIKVLRTNLARHGLHENVRIISVGEEDPAAVIPANGAIALLFIDADGALDRDFLLYYRRLVPGAPVILDDYHDIINKHARNGYLKFTKEEERSYVKARGVKSLRDVVPLGKEYSTYRFAGTLIEHGFLSVDRMIGRTLFARKPSDPALNERFATMERQFAYIRDQIYDEYLKMRKARLKRAVFNMKRLLKLQVRPKHQSRS